MRIKEKFNEIIKPIPNIINITAILEAEIDINKDKESYDYKVKQAAYTEIMNLKNELIWREEVIAEINEEKQKLIRINGKAAKLYTEVCEDFRKITGSDAVCEMCIEDGKDECEGFVKDECFKLNAIKYLELIWCE